MSRNPATWCPKFHKQWNKFIQKTKIVIYDYSFKLSSIYSPTLLLLMTFISLSNEWFRVDEMSCKGGVDEAGNVELSSHCWIVGTFLVQKGLQTDWKTNTTYPGVTPYNRGVDEIVKQDYYNHIWMILAVSAAISAGPFLVWQFQGSQKIADLMDRPPYQILSNKERVVRFLNTRGSDRCYAYRYMFCKFMSLTTHVIILMYHTVMIGNGYETYGWNVLMFHINDSWPSPQDMLFPITAKCEKSQIGISGDEEFTSGKCDLPMNYIAKWMFFAHWWYNILTFFVSVFTYLKLCCICVFPHLRHRQFKLKPIYTCGELGNGDTGYGVVGGVNKNYKNTAKLSFNEWANLLFLSKNLKPNQFSEFLHDFLETKINERIYTNQIPMKAVSVVFQ